MASNESAPTAAFRPGEEVRPDRAYLRYALIVSALTGPAFPIVFLSMYFKYITLRYRFDGDEDGGVWMAQGILFKKEVSLTYRRIQDIHVTRNLIERWVGLARVAVQTASGSSTPEMTVEGVLDADGLRDFLYQRMRGAKGQAGAVASRPADALDSRDDEALVVLREIRDALGAVRERVARGNGGDRI
jgi:putative membrane protein